MCYGTGDLALSERGQEYKVKHTRYSAAKITAAREALAVDHTLGEDLAGELEVLTNTTVSDQQERAFLDQNVPLHDQKDTRWNDGREPRPSASGTNSKTARGPIIAPRRGRELPWWCFGQRTPRNTNSPPSEKQQPPSATSAMPSTALPLAPTVRSQCRPKTS